MMEKCMGVGWILCGMDFVGTHPVVGDRAYSIAPLQLHVIDVKASKKNWGNGRGAME
jgi:hypothetical protein